jgi:hypothetical protein
MGLFGGCWLLDHDSPLPFFLKFHMDFSFHLCYMPVPYDAPWFNQPNSNNKLHSASWCNVFVLKVTFSLLGRNISHRTQFSNTLTQPQTPSNTLTHPQTPSHTLKYPHTPSNTLTHPQTPSNTLTHPQTHIHTHECICFSASTQWRNIVI